MVGLILRIKRLLNISSANVNSRNKTKEVQVTESPSTNESASGKSTKNQVASRYENGREYTDQENVQYILPKDIDELDRLHQQHWMLKFAFQGNFGAPVEEELKKGITVLDSGCGPGTWTLEMAEDYPNSKFYGVDMANVFPEQIKPRNCEFHLANLNEGLPFPDNHFDYVHQRLLVGGLTAEGWEKALSEFTRVLKPGGWLELKEIKFTSERSGPVGSALCQTMVRFLQSRNMIPDIACELGDYLEKKGFQDIKVKKLGVPVNHGGKLGSLHWEDTREVLTSLKPVLFKLDPVTYKDDESFTKTLDTIEAECKEYGTIGYWFDSYGRKPLA